MKNLLNKIIFRGYTIYCCEEDVTNVISTITQTRGFLNNVFIKDPTAMSCGWKNSNVWFISFTGNKKQWTEIKNKLNVKRIWYEDLPYIINKGYIYSTN